MPDQSIANSENTNARLKVGLIVESEFASKYVHELVQWAQTQNELFLSHLVIERPGTKRQGLVEKAIGPSGGRGFLEWIRRATLTLIVRFENLRIKREKYYNHHLRLFSLRELIPESVTISPITSKTGPTDQCSVEGIQQVRDLGLDVLLHCSLGPLRPELLKSARFGVISFRYSEVGSDRGGPPGFWEVYRKQDNSGFILQQWNSTFDGGNILVSGRFPTQGYFLLNQAALYTKSNFYLKKILSDLAADRALPSAQNSQSHRNPLLKVPTVVEQLKYISRLGFAILFHAIGGLLAQRHHRWEIAYAYSDWKTLVMRRAIKIKSPPNHFLADPFVIREGDRDYCFAEDYDYQTSRGCICVYELKASGAERLREVIAEPFHLSFPFIFRFDSKLYMCPEASENNEIRLYECVNFPLEWKLFKVLMSNVSAVDTMIFEHDGLWWLFTNVDPTNTESHCSELFIFYSDNPLGQEWCAHPKSPFVIDSARGRNAGILFDDSWIYRVSQKQGFNLYGKGFSINKIVVLNRDEYLEAEVCSVEPNFFPKLLGCHHLHSNGKITVFDYLRYTRINS